MSTQHAPRLIGGPQNGWPKKPPITPPATAPTGPATSKPEPAPAAAPTMSACAAGEIVATVMIVASTSISWRIAFPRHHPPARNSNPRPSTTQSYAHVYPSRKLPYTPLDLAEKVEATLLCQVPEIADQVCDGMLITGVAVSLKYSDGLGGLGLLGLRRRRKARAVARSSKHQTGG